MICPKCGNQLNEGAVFCPKCGHKIENGSNDSHIQTANTDFKKKPKRWKTVLLLIIIICGVGFMACCVIGPKYKNNIFAFLNANSKATDEVIGYLDQAEVIVQQCDDDYHAINQEDKAGVLFRERADIMQTAYTELEELKEKTSQIQGADLKLKEAVNQYFEMIISSKKSLYEVTDFYSTYFTLICNPIVDTRPKLDEYDGDISKYYNDLNTWNQSAIEGFNKIESYPVCVASEWEQYKKVFEINNTIIEKGKIADKYNDNLRHYSAICLSNRYDVLEENAYNKLDTCVKGEVDYAQAQRKIAAKLMEEIRSYIVMDEESRLNYEFQYNLEDKISIQYEAVDTIYPSLYNTYDAFVIVKTGCRSGNRQIVIEAEIPGFTQKYKQKFTIDASYQTINIKPAALTEKLDLSTAKDAQINISVYEIDGSTLIDAKTFPLIIKSRNDFELVSDEFEQATKDNLLCFLTPESDSIVKLKRTAIDELSAMTGGRMESFVGYQLSSFSSPYVMTYLQAAGIMRAMNMMGVRYNMDPFSVSGSNQHIQLPEEVLNNKSGLCIETSLLVASALQSAGMHAFLVFPPGHAQVAVEIWDNETNAGKGEYFLIETTAVDDNSNNRNIFVNGANQILQGKSPAGSISYYNAQGWSDYLQGVQYIVDCDDSRILGLTPFAN